MTLVEVIIGITILSLIATMSFTKINLSNYKVNAFAKQMASDIRYVRKINRLGNSKVYMYFTKQNNTKGYILRKSVFLPEGVDLRCPVSKIFFKTNGCFYIGGTTISIIQKNNYTEITIVPTSGRVLIKEGIYK